MDALIADFAGMTALYDFSTCQQVAKEGLNKHEVVIPATPIWMQGRDCRFRRKSVLGKALPGIHEDFERVRAWRAAPGDNRSNGRGQIRPAQRSHAAFRSFCNRLARG